MNDCAHKFGEGQESGGEVSYKTAQAGAKATTTTSYFVARTFLNANNGVNSAN